MPVDPGTPDDPPPPRTDPPPPSLLAAARLIIDDLAYYDSSTSGRTPWTTTEVAAWATVRARLNQLIVDQTPSG